MEDKLIRLIYRETIRFAAQKCFDTGEQKLGEELWNSNPTEELMDSLRVKCARNRRKTAKNDGK